MGRMTAQELAEDTYRELLKSYKRFRESERDYDAITEVYEHQVRIEFRVPEGQELRRAQKLLAKQRAERDPHQIAAQGVCRYFLDRTAMLAAVYQIERDRAAMEVLGR